MSCQDPTIPRFNKLDDYVPYLKYEYAGYNYGSLHEEGLAIKRKAAAALNIKPRWVFFRDRDTFVSPEALNDECLLLASATPEQLEKRRLHDIIRRIEKLEAKLGKDEK